MRNRVALALSFVAFLAFVGLSPAQAEDKKKFEGVLHAPNESLFSTADLICPDGGPGNGINYAWIDLGAGSQFKFFKLMAPHLVGIPDAGGVNAGQNIGEHDLDLYLYDDKCKDITTHTNNLNSSVNTDTRRPARYALINYYVGVHPNVAYTFEASVSKIK